MTNEEFVATVRPLRAARPFHPFMIEMNDGTRHEIDIPMAIGFRDGSISVITPERKFRFFVVADVRRITTVGERTVSRESNGASNLKEPTMTNEEFALMVKPLHEARPFQPFVIEMGDGTRLEIDIPGALGYRDGTFGFAALGRGPRIFQVKNIRQIIPTSAGKAVA